MGAGVRTGREVYPIEPGSWQRATGRLTAATAAAPACSLALKALTAKWIFEPPNDPAQVS